MSYHPKRIVVGYNDGEISFDEMGPVLSYQGMSFKCFETTTDTLEKSPIESWFQVVIK